MNKNQAIKPLHQIAISTPKGITITLSDKILIHFTFIKNLSRERSNLYEGDHCENASIKLANVLQMTAHPIAICFPLSNGEQKKKNGTKQSTGLTSSGTLARVTSLEEVLPLIVWGTPRGQRILEVSA